jgi:DnaK suppressor protein
MDLNDIDQFKITLTQWLDTISRHSNQTLAGYSNSYDNWPDPIDRASVELEMDFAFSKLRKDGLSKRSIVNALQKIEDGVYGICEGCGEKISKARLSAIPDTSCCVECQTELERNGRLLWA